MAPRLQSFLTASKTAGKHDAGSQRRGREEAAEREKLFHTLAISLLCSPQLDTYYPLNSIAPRL